MYTLQVRWFTCLYADTTDPRDGQSQYVHESCNEEGEYTKREENNISDEDSSEPYGCKVNIPVPGGRGITLETCQEAITDYVAHTIANEGRTDTKVEDRFTHGFRTMSHFLLLERIVLYKLFIGEVTIGKEKNKKR